MAKEYARKFYNSKKWKECRASYIQSVFGLCERCMRPGHIVHHIEYITPENINDPNITLNHNNLEYLCQECHNKEHHASELNTRDGLRFDRNGFVVKE